MTDERALEILINIDNPTFSFEEMEEMISQVNSLPHGWMAILLGSNLAGIILNLPGDIDTPTGKLRNRFGKSEQFRIMHQKYGHLLDPKEK
jgi:hypothetical protein